MQPILRNLATGISLAGLLCWCACKETQITRTGDPEVADEVERLRASTELSEACAGFGSVLNCQTQAFRTLLAHPDAARYFRALTDAPGLPAQAYGLIGLSLVDPDQMALELPAFLESTEPIPVQFGDVIEGLAAEEIATLIAEGSFAEQLRSAECSIVVPPANCEL